VSSALKASSTPVIGLPTPVAARFSTTCGASVGAGSGNISTHSASVPDTPSASSSATMRSPTPLASDRAAASVSRSRATAPISIAPVRPPPIAASVSATSMPYSRTHTSDNSSP
jgi:hypothetical protein